MIQTLQLFCSKNIGKYDTIIWLTKNQGNGSANLISFYRNLGFYPTMAINFPLSNALPSKLVYNLHTSTYDAYNETGEFLLQTRKKIRKINNEINVTKTMSSNEVRNKCEICAQDISSEQSTVLCQHTMKGSMRVIYSKNKKKQNQYVVL